MLRGLAKQKNMQPKTNSKSHKEKEKKYKEMMKNRIKCKKCHRSDVTLLKKQDKKGKEYYICTSCNKG